MHPMMYAHCELNALSYIVSFTVAKSTPCLESCESCSAISVQAASHTLCHMYVSGVHCALPLFLDSPMASAFRDCYPRA